MTGVFYVADVFQKIIDCLYHRPFAHQYLISYIHQLILHTLPWPGNQMNARVIQLFKQPLTDIAPIPEELPS